MKRSLGQQTWLQSADPEQFEIMRQQLNAALERARLRALEYFKPGAPS